MNKETWKYIIQTIIAILTHHSGRHLLHGRSLT